MELLRAIRRQLVAIRDGIDHRLHRGRREAAKERLARLAPESFLVVCLGNICRSPYAARLLIAADEGLRVDSAGFIGPGRPPPEEALQVAGERGVAHSDHRSKQLNEAMVVGADVILAFDRNNMRRLRVTPGVDRGRVFWLGDFDPMWSGRRAIADPWGNGLDAFRAAFDRIDRCSAVVLQVVRAGRR